MKRLLPLLTLLVALTAGADEPFTFKVIGFDCDECAPPIVKALSSVPGVSRPEVNPKTHMVTVQLAPGSDREKVRKALTNLGFGAVFPGEKETGFVPPPESVLRTLDIVSYPGKNKVDIAKVVVPGKVTIVDFYGEWCGPCRVLEARLQHLMAGDKPNLALRRVDIGKWDNAAARQVTREFKGEALPYIRVYDAKGRFVEAVTGGMWDEVLIAIEKAEAQR
ncbi:MAG TPA: thioredoxin domain-containing protein [Thermoanaerobaculia bacterium]|nr:thioredoxin domain-containing protein [Thermoanaerobaculia bacterium]